MHDTADKSFIDWKWAAGIFATILILLVGGWAVNVNQTLAAQEQENRRVAAEHAGIMASIENIEGMLADIREHQQKPCSGDSTQ